jgi:hypothetical protein
VGLIKDDDKPVTKFYVVDASTDKTFEYDVSGKSVENYGLRSGNSDPRGAASDASGERVWVIDNDDYVYVYDAAGNSLGSWRAKGLNTPEGIASNGTDIWIVDRGTDRVYRYAGGANRTSGNTNPTSHFALNSGNKEPRGIETDGTHLWVVDDSSINKVFKYTLSGSLRGSWTINGTNTTPTGITLDPSNPSDVWIVDAGRDQVFQYTAASSRTSGSQSASAVFNLAPGNTNPQGIADPPPPGTARALETGLEAGLAVGDQGRTLPRLTWSAMPQLETRIHLDASLRDARPSGLNRDSMLACQGRDEVTWKCGTEGRPTVSGVKASEKDEDSNLDLFAAHDTVFADADELGDILNR